MKKLYTLIIGVSISALTFAQNAEVYTYESATIGATDISGTQVDYVVNTDGLVVKHFYMKSLAAVTNDIKLERKILSEPAGWQDGVCWGRPVVELSPDFQGQCYGSSQMPNAYWISPTALTIPANEGGEVIVDINVNSPGTGCYRYIFKRGSAAWDSLDVCVTKTVSIEEKEELAFSVYPNPANNYINVTTKGTDGTSLLKITDVLGKVVFEETISESKKLDVSEFKNGVYMLTVIEDGNAIKTKRIVVRH